MRRQGSHHRAAFRSQFDLPYLPGRFDSAQDRESEVHEDYVEPLPSEGLDSLFAIPYGDALETASLEKRYDIQSIDGLILGHEHPDILVD